MAIIYSYPTVQPTADDLLIGTDVGEDNATKSFTLASVAALVGQIASAGTVTSVQIATDAFLSATGGPINTAGTITVGLAATGTPSSSTFLRGDNVWVTPTVSAGIFAYNQNNQLTEDMSSINFRGSGVVASSNSTGDVVVQIDGAASGVTTIENGVGISLNQNSGDVVVTNTGVTSIVAGSNITLSSNTTGAVTVSANSSGSVTVVQPGTGLTLESGLTTANPTIGLDYLGNDNFIKQGESATVTTSSDFILFEDVSSGDVKSTTLGSIPTSSLTLVDESISSAVEDVVKNDTDTFTSLGNVRNVITLTDAEYTALSAKDGNTLYLTTSTALPTVRKTLNTIISTGITGTEYSLDPNYDVIGSFREGAQGGNYEFDTRIILDSGYRWNGSPPTIQNAAGTLDTTGNVTTNLGTGTIEEIPSGTCTAVVSIDNQIVEEDGATEGVQYTIVATNPTISGNCPKVFNSLNFDVQVSLASGVDPTEWQIVSPSYSYSPASGTVENGGTTTVVCTVRGTVVKRSYNVTYNLTDNISGGTLNTDYTISNGISPGVAATGTAPPQTIFGPIKHGTNCSITSTYASVANSGTTTTITNAASGTITGNSCVNSVEVLGNTIINETITGVTSAVLAAPSFHFEAFNKNIACVQTSDPQPSCSTNPVGYTYATMTYTVQPPNGVQSPPISISVGDTVTQYNNNDFQDQTIIRFTLNDPVIDPGFATTDGPITTSWSGANASGELTLVSGSAQADVTVTQSGSISNRLNSTTISSVVSGTPAAACGTNTNTGVFLQKATGNTLAFAQDGDVVWLTQYGTTQPSAGYYRSAIGDGTGGGQPGTIQLSASGVVSNAALCPEDGYLRMLTDVQIVGNSGGYTLTPTHTINGGTSLTGSTVTTTVGNNVEFTQGVSLNPGYTLVTPFAVTYNPGQVLVSQSGTSPANPTETTATVTGEVSLPQSFLSSSTQTQATVCSAQANTQTGYHTGSAALPGVGNSVYTDSALTTPYADGYYSSGYSGYVFQITSGVVVGPILQCNANSLNTSVFHISESEACSDSNTSAEIWYSDSTNPQVGSVYYTSRLYDPLNPPYAPDGYYRTQYQTEVIRIFGNGAVSSISNPCTP